MCPVCHVMVVPVGRASRMSTHERGWEADSVTVKPPLVTAGRLEMQGPNDALTEMVVQCVIPASAGMQP